MTDGLLSIAQMCARFDVTPRTLRYYEQIELLSPQRRGRHRLYGPRELARMTLILRGRHFGFSLEEIRQWLEMYVEKGTQAQLQTFIDTADRRIATLIAEQAERATMIEDLRSLRETAQQELAAKA